MEGVALVTRGTGSTALVVMLDGGVCSAVTGVSMLERSIREGVVLRVLTMTPWREKVHVLGVTFGAVMNALLPTTAPRPGAVRAARGIRLRNILGAVTAQGARFIAVVDVLSGIDDIFFLSTREVTPRDL